MKPRLREIDARSIHHQGQPMLLLRDPLALSDTAIAVPQTMVPLLGLMDGSRDEAELEAALRVRAGVRLAPGLLAKLLADLDEAYLLDNERSRQALEAELRAYRSAPFRPLTTLDGDGALADPEQAAGFLQGYVDALPPREPAAVDRPIRGLISPHIDYLRGGPVYAEVWRAAAQAAREAELVVILGTDHQGGDGALTLTRQSYATPWGVLPTDQEAAEVVIKALGQETAFDEELHHRVEHSIELAASWLHFVRNGEPVSMLPILCGSFGRFVHEGADPADHEPFTRAVDALQQLMGSRRTLVVAAADLAHVGPAFGDRHGVDFIARAQLRNADERLLAAVYEGSPGAFFEQLRAEGDRRRVCGLPPIYLSLRVLGETVGEAAGYDLCPADPQGLSYVTIAGVILH